MQRNSINKVILVGHIGNKPEGRYIPSGTSTASFSLATNESWIDSDKVKQERTEWHNIIAWGKLADFATEYIQKGQLVYIEGRLQTRNWQDKDGNSRKTTEIVCTAITPLEWKQVKNSTAFEDKDVEKAAESTEEDLPF
jgi:single-strand DNA-binding protein